MNSKIFSAIIFFVLVVSSVSIIAADSFVIDYKQVPGHVRGIERITNYDPRIQDHKWEDIVHLEPPTNKPIMGRGYNKRQILGTAYVSTNQAYNPPIAQGGASIKVKGLPTTYKTDKLYEGWLVDEDSGYWLSLGMFSTDNFGNGRLNQATAIGNMPEKQRLFHVLDAYDAVAVTLEPWPDIDPRPTDAVALYGKITKPKFFTPEPTVQQRLWGSTKYYASSSYNNPIANIKKTVDVKK